MGDADLLPVSALQHLLFCERQCALIHIERIWVENRLTVEGQHLHHRADSGRPECRSGVPIARGIELRSLRLGLIGKADVVEFHGTPRSEDGDDDASRVATAKPRPYPIEYKRGRPKRDGSDRVQLCAQAICLEEMLGVSVPRGALYYGKTRRRLEVEFDESLRTLTEQAATRLREMVESGRTPKAVYEPKCESCSLINLCLPKTAAARSARRYLDHALTVAPGTGPREDPNP